MLAEHEKIVVEGAGATGLAALLQHGTKFKNKKVGIVICGGNIDSTSIVLNFNERSSEIRSGDNFGYYYA